MAKKTDGKPLSEKYRAFFQPLVDKVRNDPQWSSNKPKASGRPNEDFASGHGGVVYGANFHGSTFHAGICIAVCLYIKNDKQLFDQLEGRKKSIESQLGKLDWARLDGSDGGKHSNACRISALRDGTIEDASKNPEAIREWMIERLVAFRRVFGPELDGLLR